MQHTERETASSRLLERAGELDAIDVLITDARAGRGTALVLEGHAGVGKTSLLGVAAARASKRGVRILEARGEELESEFPFGMALRLIEPVVASDLIGAIPGLTRGFVQGTVAFTGSSRDLFELLDGLYRLTVAVSDRAPLLLIVDDAQWADAESLRFLVRLAGRIGSLPTSLILATRRPVPSPVAADLLARLSAQPRTRVRALEPLSSVAVRRLVDAELDGSPHEARAAIVDSVAGSPLLCRELLREVHRIRLGSEPVSASAVESIRTDRLRRIVRTWLAQLRADAWDVAAAVAVLDGSATPVSVAALNGMNVGRVADCIDLLVAAGLFDEGPPLAFVHPLVREIVYGDTGPARLLVLHAAAARHLQRVGASVEEVGAHLLLGDVVTGGWVVPVLRAAAAAVGRKDPVRAAELLGLALARAPMPTDRMSCLLELGRVEASLGAATAVERLTQALELLPPDAEDARVVLDVAEALYGIGRFPEAADAFRRGLDLCRSGSGDSGDPAFAARLMTGLASVEALLPRLSPEPQPPRTTPGATAGPPSSEQGRASLAFAAGDHARRSDVACERVLGLVERALGEGDAIEALGRAAIEPVAFALLACDQFDQALELLDAVIGRARWLGSVREYASLLPIRGACALERGRIAEAASDAMDAIRLIADEPTASRQALALAHHLQAVASLALGDIEAARRAVDVPAAADLWGPTPMYAWFLDGLARVQFASGDHQQALLNFQDAGARFVAAGGPGVFCSWRSSAALAALASGQLAVARTLADEEEELARRFGAPRALAVALRCRARLLDEPGDRVDVLEEARQIVAVSEADLECARVLVDLGAALRRAGHRRDARDRLRDGMDQARRFGARSLVDRAEAELKASGARRPTRPRTGVDALTPSEARIAALAAEGLSNPEIAHALVVSRKTVEVHLSSVYRKTGIRSRHDLPTILAHGPG